MAVAKAQGQGGFTAIHIWLIIFVALWLASTVLLVILYLDQDKKVAAVDEMRDQLNKVLSAEGRRLPQFTAAKPASGQTLVDLLEKARAETAEIAAGDPAADVPALRAKLNAQLERARADNYVEDPAVFDGVSYDAAIATMYELFHREAKARDEAEAGLEAMNVQLTELRAAQAQQKQQFEEETGRLRDQLTAIDQAKIASLQTHESQIDDFDAQLERIKQQCSDDIQAQRSENASLRRDNEELLARDRQLREKLGLFQVAPVPLATARTADGKVLTATPGDNVVYINLGARDHLTLGLEFSVYDALGGIPEDGRAKARIEVVSIDERTAVCRIKELLRGDMVLEGDLIANPIYDRHRTLRFYVLGLFDLDRDGRDDPDGPERIKALIANWGGAIEQELTAQVDFVVLGGPPKRPLRAGDFDSDGDDDRTAEAQRALDAYHAQLQTVDVLAIPRLTQSVLLNFLGYNGAQSFELGRLTAAAPILAP